MVCYAAKLTDTKEKQQMGHSPWYHITPFRVILVSGWIMAFQRTECSLGPLIVTGRVNLKSIRHTSVRRELAIDRIMIPHLSVCLPSFYSGQISDESKHRITWNHPVSHGHRCTVSEFHLQGLPRLRVYQSVFWECSVGHPCFRIR